MPFSFFETMRGNLVDPCGGSHPVDLEIKVEATHLGHFAHTGIARVSGIVNVLPWATSAAVEGTIEMHPITRGTISYRLSFGDGLRLHGRKKLRVLDLPHTMSTLEVELSRRGEQLARGPLRFDLSRLQDFLRSWWPSSTIEAVSPSVAGLTEAELEILDQFVAALLVGGEHTPQPDAVTTAEAARLLGGFPRGVQVAYRAALRILDVLALFQHGRLFAGLNVGLRSRLVQGVVDRPGTRMASVLNLLALPVKLAHFNCPEYLDGIRVSASEPVAPGPEPAYLRQVTPAEDLALHTDLEAEVVVIGTGAGGAAIAATLAERGVAVALLEAGHLHLRQEFSGAPYDRVQKFWNHAGMEFSIGNVPIAVPSGRMVGGTTAINSGTCFPTPDGVLKCWRRRGLPEDFEPENFARWLDQVAQDIDVSPSDPHQLGDIARVVARGADAMGYGHGPLLRNAIGCDGRGTCTMGCPTDAKRSTNVTYIPRALRAGAALFTGLPVTRVLMRGDTAVAIEARGADQNGVQKCLRIRAAAIVIAAGTLRSPVLLQESGIRLRHVGRNLSIHPGFGMLALLDRPSTPWSAIPQGYGVHGHPLEGVRYEGFYLPPQMVGIALPLAGAELTRWMDNAARLSQFGFMVRDENRGRVWRGTRGEPVIQYNLSTRSIERLQRGAALLAELLLLGGAQEVLAGVGAHRIVKTVAAARAIAVGRARATDFSLMGCHPLGTARMGVSAQDSVVDGDHRVHGTSNLYVVDGSAVPSSLGVNPQVTIKAMALRAGERLARQFVQC